MATSGLLFGSGVGAPGVAAQVGNLGLPFVRNFEKSAYAGGTQSWGFAQDRFGTLHVANNDGLLTFDGERWTTYPLPNRTIARSVMVHQSGVYVGGQGIFGRFRRDIRTPRLLFDTLSALLPEGDEDFDDVWHVAAEAYRADGGSSIFFQTTDAVFRYGPDRPGGPDGPGRPVGASVVERLDRDAPVLYLGSAAGEVYLHGFERGLSVWRDGGFRLLDGSEVLEACAVVSVDADAGGRVFVTTLDCGIYVVDAPAARIEAYPIAQQDYLLGSRVQTAALLPDGTLALGTGREGVLLVDLERRRIHQRLDRAAGLQNANVRACFADAAGDLWLGLDNGIDHVDVASPYLRLSPDGELGGATYAVQGFGDSLYVGTSNGLYVAALGDYRDPLTSEPPFRLVAGSEGQVWGLDVVDGELLLGHHEGAFRVRPNGLTRIGPELGYWKFLPGADGEVVAGAYEGLRTLRRSGLAGRWRVDTMTGFRESARILATAPESQDIWVGQPYKGVYRVRPDERGTAEVTFYGVGAGLPSDDGNHVFALRNEIVVGAQNGVYRYDAAADSFLLHEGYTDALGAGARVVRLVSAPGGDDVYYVTDADAGVLDIETEGLTQRVTRRSFGTIRPLLLGGFELVAPQPGGEVLVGAEEGLLSVSLGYARAGDTPRVHIHAVEVTAGRVDSAAAVLRVGGLERWWPDGGGVRYGPGVSGLRFAFAATAFGALDEIEYQTRLRGLEDDFSMWTTAAEREYTNLGHGDYVFEVRARLRGSGEVLRRAPTVDLATFRFEIAPPWYATVLAKAAYVLLGLLALALLYYLPRRRYQREQLELLAVQEAKRQSLLEEKAAEQRALETAVQASEEEIEALKSEKLAVELASRHRELADVTMHVVQKNELLQRLRDELEGLRAHATDPAVRRGLRQTVRLITDDERGEDDWLTFVGHFDQVHEGFFARLRERYPALTTKDHKLCAYLRMGLSTKEIAPLLNISVRGVEIGRYRLRKKLALEKGEDLGQWVRQF